MTPFKVRKITVVVTGTDQPDRITLYTDLPPAHSGPEGQTLQLSAPAGEALLYIRKHFPDTDIEVAYDRPEVGVLAGPSGVGHSY